MGAAGPHRGEGRGFSLLEVIFSSTIFITALTGVVSAIGTSRQIKEDHRMLTQALHLAEGQIEQLLVLPNGAAQLTSDVEVAGSRYDIDGAVVPAGGIFTTAWVVQADTPVTGLRRINVVVRWTDGQGRARKFSLTTDRT